MKKHIKALLSIFMVAVFMLSLTACQKQQELNVFTWEGYIPDEVVKDFEAKTGIRINYSNFDNNEQMLSKLKAQSGQYDIILCSDYIIDIMGQEQLLDSINWSKLSNAGNIDSAYQSKYFDPDNKYTIPYATASAIIVYDKDKTGFDIESYSDFWRPELKDKLVMLDGDRDIIGLTLMKLGYSVNETDPAKLEQAKQELLALKDNIIGLDANTPFNYLIDGRASAGFMYGSQAVAAIAEVPSLKLAYPKEGLSIYEDCIVVPREAPNIDNAYIFMNYILEGSVSAKISELINYPNCNTAAKAFLSKEYLDNKAVNIPSELAAKAEPVENVGDAATIYSEIWTEFKTK